MRDLDSNDVETAARLEQHQAMPDDPPSPDEYLDTCECCGGWLLPSEGSLCDECLEWR
jgi:hypothetical protein